jgi:predicted DCC family thiol-disulfide oxidoreductase YuxK
MHADRAQPDLPRPGSSSAPVVVIYDGRCPVCRRAVERLHRWDWRDRLAFLRLHDPDVARRWPDLSHEKLMQSVHVITPDGDRLRGARAMRRLSRMLPALWPLVPLLHLPGSLSVWQWGYDWFARHRYVFGGRTADHCDDDTCGV